MYKWIISKNKQVLDGAPDGVPVAIAEMLAARGISGADAADFLSDMPRETYDPFLFRGLKDTAVHILELLEQGKKICIYGDYDADGVTSTALLYTVFSCFSDQVSYYIPSRFIDGYGLNIKALDRIKAEEDPDLLITVDCGSTSKKEAAYAKELGMEVIVTDHHTIDPENLPDCTVLNPIMAESGYPFCRLSGCGVAFKLAQGIQRIAAGRGDDRFTRSDLNNLLDIVAISTIADVVPLLGENRTLIKYGLKILNERRRPGIKALLDVLELSDAYIDSDKVAYIIAPHINALGRMGSARLGVELLAGLHKSEAELKQLAMLMVQNNIERRRVQEETKDLCLQAMITEDCGSLFPVILAEKGHEGVAGIVAGNLKEQLYRPVFILTGSGDGKLKGTGRSISGINLHELMSGCSRLFIRYGGHAGACGFSMEADKLPALRAYMQDAMKKLTAEDPELLTEKLFIDRILEDADLTLDFAEELNRMEPYGEANPRPVFCIPGVRILSPSLMGAEHQHVRFSIRTAGGRTVSCVLFKKAAEYADLLTGRSLCDAAGELSVNEFNGRKKLQLVIKDIRRSL